LLSRVYDIERLMTRVMYKRLPRDLKALSVTALQLPEIKKQLNIFRLICLLSLTPILITLQENINLIENAIVDDLLFQ
jgi:DNA mismatch repair protein MutS